MALTLGDNFSYQGAKPLDARLKYDTVAAMKAVADSTLYDGCLAYCVATDKTYQWKSTNTVDTTLGRWREFETTAIDSALSGSSENPVQNKVIKQALDDKADLVDGKIPAAQMPSYVDDVLEYEDLAHFPATGESGKIYIAQDTNKTYRWSGTGYAEISESLALGETSSSAYRGDRGKTAYDFSQNPATATPLMDGVGNVGSSEKWAKEDHVHPSDSAKSNLFNLAAAFDDSATYAIGDRVTYEGKIYRFTAAHTGAWVAADAVQTTVDDEIPEELTAAQMADVKSGFAPTNVVGVEFGGHVYSPNEQVVGRWQQIVDGVLKEKPLYEKTIEGTLPTETNEIQTFATHGITNIDNVHIVASSAQATDGTWYNIGIASTLSVWDAWVNINNIQNKIAAASLVSQTGYITLQYTKTTDTWKTV